MCDQLGTSREVKRSDRFRTLMGLVFLVAGIGRWIADAKVVNQAPGPGQQQPWGGYQEYPQQHPPYSGQYEQ